MPLKPVPRPVGVPHVPAAKPAVVAPHPTPPGKPTPTSGVVPHLEGKLPAEGAPHAVEGALPAPFPGFGGRISINPRMDVSFNPPRSPRALPETGRVVMPPGFRVPEPAPSLISRLQLPNIIPLVMKWAPRVALSGALGTALGGLISQGSGTISDYWKKFYNQLGLPGQKKEGAYQPALIRSLANQFGRHLGEMLQQK